MLRNKLRNFRYNPIIVKKALLYALLVLFVGLFTSTIVQSFSDGHVLSNSSRPELMIPSGEYETYLKRKITGIEDPARLANIELNDLTIPTPTIDSFSLDLTQGVASADSLWFQYMGDVNTTSIILDNGQKHYGYYTSDEGSVTFSFNNITEPGFYHIYVTYFPERLRDVNGNIMEHSGGANIERRLYINGEVPFATAENLTFYRIWTDRGSIVKDLSGNDMKPAQREIFDLSKTVLRDDSGFIVEPYLFYLQAGVNELTFESVREHMSFVDIEVASVNHVPSYAQYIANHSDKAIQSDIKIRVEGEDSTRRSSPTLYAVADRTSPLNIPVHPVQITLNAIGGRKWNTPGDWIEWDVVVPQAGMYNITFKAKQNTSRGLFSTRRIYVNGEIPFEEAYSSQFQYNSKWDMVTIGSNEEAFLFYLEEGVNQIRLEATLGAYGEPIQVIQNVTNNLNQMYLRIIAITTITPDPYQNYHLFGENARIEGLLETFASSAKQLRDVVDYLTLISGEKSEQSAILEKMAIQLEDFVDNPRTIQERLATFTQNISALGTWIQNVRQQSLTIEALYVSTPDVTLPNANANFFATFWFQLRAFFLSFFFDYESIGVTASSGTGKEIEVWFLTSAEAGREQANALKTLSDNTFTSETGIDVLLKVVAPHVLLPATLAGTGPDVAINVENGLPVNYALRSATYDLSTFDDFITIQHEWGVDLFIDGEATPRFQRSAMVPYEYNGGFYALPNTHSFLVMFYRMDIFEERGWLVPETWREVTNLVTELQVSNLQFFLPLSLAGATSFVNPVFASMLYQRGGRFYTDDFTRSNFDSEEAMLAFEEWTKYYTDYSFPLAANFLNRFRTGETPIGIASYELFNTLVVFAPEITGKWTFAPLPGTVQPDGSVDNRGAAFGTAVTMMKSASDPESAWKFMKWWTSAPTQRSYAIELESILGAAARHNTANIEAFMGLPWTREERNVLLAQWETSVGVPEVPGGYYTGRNLENAFRKTINQDLNPREVLGEYIDIINGEITKKRREFGLPTA